MQDTSGEERNNIADIDVSSIKLHDSDMCKYQLRESYKDAKICYPDERDIESDDDDIHFYNGSESSLLKKRRINMLASGINNNGRHRSALKEMLWKSYIGGHYDYFKHPSEDSDLLGEQSLLKCHTQKKSKWDDPKQSIDDEDLSSIMLTDYVVASVNNLEHSKEVMKLAIMIDSGANMSVTSRTHQLC